MVYVGISDLYAPPSNGCDISILYCNSIALSIYRINIAIQGVIAIPILSCYLIPIWQTRFIDNNIVLPMGRMENSLFPHFSSRLKVEPKFIIYPPFIRKVVIGLIIFGQIPILSFKPFLETNPIFNWA